MADTTLASFVRDALRAGATRDQTEKALADAGWSSEQVRDAMAAYAEVEFPVPVPRPRPQLSARDAFMYLVMFGMLYVSALQFGSLLFAFINLAFPDPLRAGARAFLDEQIRFATAALLVAFPVFLFTASRIARRVASDPAQRMSAVRKWLTYLTLFVAACVIVGDLIALLYGVLAGELTMRFTLKALVVGLIAAGIFSYYLWSMRADDRALAR